MNAFAVVSPQDLAIAPEPRTRTCPFCYERDPRNAKHDLTDDWHCTGCGRRVVCHHEVAPCRSCSRPAPTRYLGNRIKQWCTCRLSAAEQEAIQLREVEMERQAAIARRKALESELAEARAQREVEALQRKADRCWEAKRQSCNVLAKRPIHSFCGECVHLKPRTMNRRIQPVEFEECDF